MERVVLLEEYHAETSEQVVDDEDEQADPESRGHAGSKRFNDGPQSGETPSQSKESQESKKPKHYPWTIIEPKQIQEAHA